MSTTETLNSGDLELYVFGITSESETNRIANLSKTDSVIKNEIISIENSILQLSSSFSPSISSEVYEKIKTKLELKPSTTITMKTKSNWSNYLGWSASIALLIGIGYQYQQQTTIENKIVTIEKEKTKLNEAVATSENKNKQTKEALAIIRDAKNTVVSLGGQAVSPTSYAKVYWNKETEVVYVDAAGLPEPPEGMVYQVWSLKLSPTLTPTSIGLLENFKSDDNKLFAVSKTGDAEAFGITLEPAGGSATPTMEQLYTLGKV
jgi:anti-sigma-K factor RskA